MSYRVSSTKNSHSQHASWHAVAKNGGSCLSGGLLGPKASKKSFASQTSKESKIDWGQTRAQNSKMAVAFCGRANIARETLVTNVQKRTAKNDLEQLLP